MIVTVLLAIDLTLSSPVFFALLGLSFGSFGNVLIYRVPRGQSIGGRSKCPKCKRTLSPLELIPVVSFLLQGGRCRHCNKEISWQYPIVEIASALLFVGALCHMPTFPHSLLLALALWLLFLIAIIDLQTGGIPDVLNGSFLVLSALLHFLRVPFSFDAAIPAVIGGGFFALQWLVSRGKWVGSGDIILGTAIGFLLGTWHLVVTALWFSYVLGSLVAILLIMRRRKTLQDILPFGPFLAIGAMIALFWGEGIIDMLMGGFVM